MRQHIAQAHDAQIFRPYYYALITAAGLLATAGIPYLFVRFWNDGRLAALSGHLMALFVALCWCYTIFRIYDRNVSAKSRLLLQHGPIAVLVISPTTGQLLGINAYLAHLLGYDSPQVLLGAYRNGDFTPNVDELLALSDQTRADDTSTNYEVHLPALDGRICTLRGMRIFQHRAALAMLVDVTSQKAERELRHTLYEVLESLETGVILCDQEHRYEHINGASERMLMTSSHDIKAKTPAEAFPMIPVENIIKAYEQAAAGQIVRSEQSYYHPAWGGTKWFASVYTPRRSADGANAGSMVQVRDTTHDMETRHALRESERRFHEMMTILHQPALQVNDRGVMTYCNEYLLTLTGWHSDELIGHDFVDRLVSPDMRESMRELLQRTMTGEEPPIFHLTCAVRDRAGKIHPYYWNTITLYDVHGNPVGVAAVGERQTAREHIDF